MAKPGSRPISPHLTHYKWGPAMAASIMHRVTGDGLAIVGTLVMLWWLGALAAGPEAYATFITCMTHPVGWVVLVGLSWAFFSHLATGLRHFVMDIGAGYELKNNALWSMLTPLIAIVLTAGTWAYILSRGVN